MACAEEVRALVGQELGPTTWMPILQPMLDRFAEVTGDQQWIHVDPVRAAQGPFGACIAHGLLTLSLAGGRILHELVRTAARRGVNYGCDRVRYPAPLCVGARIRGRAEIFEAELLDQYNVQVKVRVTVDIEGEVRPACVADFLARYYF
jgi:acyl dehydratase